MFRRVISSLVVCAAMSVSIYACINISSACMHHSRSVGERAAVASREPSRLCNSQRGAVCVCTDILNLNCCISGAFSVFMRDEIARLELLPDALATC
jgi:hypothetical protein